MRSTIIITFFLLVANVPVNAQLFDTTFAHTGWSSPTGMGGCVNSMAMQPDLKIVSAYELCYEQPANKQYLLTSRLNPDGSLDTSYGTQGTGKIWIGTNAISQDVAVQPDGKILVSGVSDYCVQLICGFPNLGVGRFLANGQTDSAFGTNGLVRSGDIFDPAHIMGASATDMFLLPSGKIIVCGFCYTDQPSSVSKYCYICRLNANGTRDNTFGIGGLYVTSPAGYYEYGSAAMDAAGNIYMSGSIYVGNYFYDVYVLKVKPNGAIDNTFGASGIAHYFHPQRYPWVQSIDVRNDGKIVIGGYYSDSLYTFTEGFVSMLEADGSLSNEIPGGIRIISPGVWTSSTVNDIQVIPDGHVIYTGDVDSSGSYHNNVRTGRLNNDGTDDIYFTGTAGDSIYNIGVYSTFGSGTYSNCILQQDDGKILVGGMHNVVAQSSWRAFTMFRLQPDSIMTSVNEMANHISIAETHPNPTPGVFTLSMGDVPGISGIEVTDVNGRIVFEKKRSFISGEEQLDLSGMENGVYFVRVMKGENAVAVGKVMVVK